MKTLYRSTFARTARDAFRGHIGLALVRTSIVCGAVFLPALYGVGGAA